MFFTILMAEIEILAQDAITQNVANHLKGVTLRIHFFNSSSTPISITITRTGETIAL
jgi:hypothetical protein